MALTFSTNVDGLFVSNVEHRNVKSIEILSDMQIVVPHVVRTLGQSSG